MAWSYLLGMHTDIKLRVQCSGAPHQAQAARV